MSENLKRNSAKAIYEMAVSTFGGNVEKISVRKLAECMTSMIEHAIKIEPAYLENKPVSFWEHKIETGEIKYMC